MTKAEIVNAVAEKTGLTKTQADNAVKAFIQSVQEGLDTDGKVQFVGFGTFKKVHKEARVGRNPQNGQALEIPARDVIQFKPSK